MAKIPTYTTIKVNVKLTLWSAIKIRIAGKNFDQSKYTEIEEITIKE